jgi:hypothetical protein
MQEQKFEQRNERSLRLRLRVRLRVRWRRRLRRGNGMFFHLQFLGMIFCFLIYYSTFRLLFNLKTFRIYEKAIESRLWTMPEQPGIEID